MKVDIVVGRTVTNIKAVHFICGIALCVVLMFSVNKYTGPDWTGVSVVSIDRPKVPKYPMPAKRRLKKILFWTPHYGSNGMWYLLGNRSFPYCRPDPCQATVDRAHVSDADAVVFHIWTIKKNDLPRHRHPRQRWVIWTQEPPSLTRISPKLNATLFGGVFNWTMTYRRDSDVWAPYRTFINREQRLKARDVRSWAAGRSKGTVAIISNCQAKRRIDFVKTLSNYTKVDLFGRCGDRPVCVQSDHKNKSLCTKNLLKEYRFVLAVENSLGCADYITEKYWRLPLDNNILPVVGGTDLTSFARLAIPHSYIHVDHFPTAKHLAIYLNALIHDDVAYGEYFRYNYLYQPVPRNYWCDLCRKLHTDASTKVYNNLAAWWETCHRN